MNLTYVKKVKNLLKKHQVRPSKRLGQNFLIDKGVIKKIIRAADLKLKDIVLEIGPGLGTLTIEIAKKVKKVIAIEKDPKMVEILKETLKDLKNIEIIKNDVLKINPAYDIPNTKYKLVGNLPFYLTAPVIRKFLEAERQPKEMVLVVQKEVGQRICAKPGKMSILAVSVQFYAKPEILSYISKKSFWPQPKVDSAIIKITPFSKNYAYAYFLLSRDHRELFFKIVKAGFSQPRKQLINNLSKSLKIDRPKIKNWLLKNNIQPTKRAETLTIEDWLNLTKSFKD
jgi:16S rRNA (adenine1518-N6/adenine1519-N6)-dimethyltransferase